MTEADIVLETKNLVLFRTQSGLALCVKSITHSVVVGHPISVDTARRTMERLERYPKNIRQMYGVF